MNDLYHCWKCGAALTGLILPMSRREECLACNADQHVCKLCRHFDPAISDACREDRAEGVTDKERANFCDYFEPASLVASSGSAAAETDIEGQLAALFGDAPPTNKLETDTDDAPPDALRALFPDDKKT